MRENYCPRAVVAGHICLDITPNFNRNEKKDIRDMLTPGKLTKVSGVKLSTGGAVANTGIALSRLGIDTKLMGKVGKDYFGNIVLELLKEYSSEEGMSVVEGACTSYTIILVPPGTDRIFLHDSGANDTFGYEDIDYTSVNEADLFHFGYPPIMKRIYSNEGEELIKIFKDAKAMDVTTSLDMCLPDPSSDAGKLDWEKQLAKLLPFVDIFIPSIEETLYMVDREYYTELNAICRGRDIIDEMDMNRLPGLGDKLLAFGAGVVAVKCGKKGYYIRTADKNRLKRMGRSMPADIENWANRELIEEAYHVSNVVSTTGAGDTSIAGFLSAYLKGMSIEMCIKAACATGAECVQAYDAISGIKPLDETLEIIRKGWEKDRIAIEGTYWKYDDDVCTWIGKKDKNSRL